MARITGCLLAACAWLAIAGTARPARGQEPDEPADAAPIPGANMANVGPDREDAGDNIEQWVYGGQGAVEGRKKLEEALARDINRYDQKYSLTSAQRKKLELAGRHDLKRFLDRIEEARAEYRRTKGDWNRMGNRVMELQSIQNQPHTELFGDGSMLAKTLKKTLTAEQVAWSEKNVYRARVEWMAGLLHKRLNLSGDQHRRVVNLLVQETPPLKRYGSFDYDAIMFQMSRLPKEKLREALHLDEAQCRELALRFDQARRMESLLVSEGYIAGVKPPAASAAGEPRKSAEREGVKAALNRAGRVGSD